MPSTLSTSGSKYENVVIRSLEQYLSIICLVYIVIIRCSHHALFSLLERCRTEVIYVPHWTVYAPPSLFAYSSSIRSSYC